MNKAYVGAALLAAILLGRHMPALPVWAIIPLGVVGLALVVYIVRMGVRQDRDRAEHFGWDQAADEQPEEIPA
ncbi:hypothetical protein [Kineosporia sp. NBRC 101731]|uniref:hypothetical protein n=1 Tax=Kineosporia sp. NBRC 101731 TaxID=3032199 RepID=UPI0024A543A3|nr:hypothetical protein [Kineosporia sp. NBRC 101731]GLY32077.1 hypothetical protein Kisp02_54420 [Kineosporia sp. NBRC 101731]